MKKIVLFPFSKYLAFDKLFDRIQSGIVLVFIF